MQETKTAIVGFRLSPQQQHLLASEARPVVAQCAALLDGPIDPVKLQASLDDALARHEILRTTFVQPTGVRTPQQVIGAESTPPLLLERESAAADSLEDGPALRALMCREAEREFDLEHGPLLRALVVGAEQEQVLLLLTACAASVDAGSLALQVNELCASYRGSLNSSEPVQYADYAEWRHELITDEEAQVQEGLAFWREEATDRPHSPRILFALPSRADGGAHACVPIDLSTVGLEELQNAATGAGVTAAIFAEASWHALLARMSGASELLVAGWCDGRAQPDLAQAVGAFEQPAPIRSRFQQTTTFVEILDQLRRARAKAVRWQDCGRGEELTDLLESAAAGWAFHAPGPPSAPARKILALRAPSGGARLMLVLRGEQSGLTGELVYDPQTVPEEDARELGGRFATILRSAISDASVPVAQLAIALETEHDRLLGEPGPPAAAGSQIPVHEGFRAQALLTPDRVAVRDASRSLSFAELDAQSNRLAAHLTSLQSERAQPIGLCLERTPSMLVAILAILKSGAPYLPLNHEHPSARIALQLSGAGASIVLTEAHLLDRLALSQSTAVCLDRDSDAIAAGSADACERLASAEDLAYVMYTSGSTGTPKGVAVTHGNLSNYAASIASRLSCTDSPGLVFGVLSAISTDLGNTSIFAPLLTGGCIRLISAEAATDGDALAAELAGEQLDVLKIAPSHLRALLGSESSAALPREWLVLGGEALSWELVEQIRSRSSGCRILNHYGPTETTVGCLTHLVEDQPRPDSLTVPIGFPLAGVRSYVLDRDLQPVPVGVPGELCIGGAGVAAGYVGATGHDDGGFTLDPLEPIAQARMYRTGDRVRHLRDGAIEFLGRLDDQVKIRGFRIEPGEVEAALSAHAAIHQVAVCAEDDERGGLRLLAYIVAPETPAVEELRGFLAASLPDHMIPTGFRCVAALPLTASGKIDRRALAGLAEVEAKREADYLAPRDAIERQIAEIWCELLGIERVGVLDDFFALGGHSLLATQATMRIRRLYGEIPLRALLAAPTVAALAEAIRARSVDGDGGR